MMKGKFTYYVLGLIIVSALFLKIFNFLQTNKEEKINSAVNKELNNQSETSNKISTYPEIMFVSPQPGEEVSSPIFVKGFAKKSWFIDGVLNIDLLDSKGQTISSGKARTGFNDTDELIPFSLELNFNSDDNFGYLLARKSSNLLTLDRDASIRISVKLK